MDSTIMKVLNKFKLNSLFIFITAITTAFVLTHIPQRNVVVRLDLPHLDKLAHLIAYALLFIFAAHAFGKPGGLARYIILGIGLILWGLFDECTQPFFGRTFDWADLLADLTGIIFAILFMTYFKKDLNINR